MPGEAFSLLIQKRQYSYGVAKAEALDEKDKTKEKRNKMKKKRQ